MSVIKTGTVFAGNRPPNVHNEIVRVYMENGKKMADVEQYGATLRNMEHERKVTFYAEEILSLLRDGTAHIELVR